MAVCPNCIEEDHAMDAQRKAIAETCPQAAETGSMAFPQIVMTLVAAGCESMQSIFDAARRSTICPMVLP